MIEFFKALSVHFSTDPTNAFYTAMGGRFRYGEAKAGCAYPYAVFHGLPSINEDTFTEEIDGLSVQVNIYSNKKTAGEAMRAITACRALFDGATITVPGHRDITLHREMETPPWKNGDDWVSSIEFITLLQKD